MADSPTPTEPTTPEPTEQDKAISPMYLLLRDKLEQDPIEFIAGLRAGSSPMPYAKIADQIMLRTGIYVTHELVRRWHLAGQAAAAAPTT